MTVEEMRERKKELGYSYEQIAQLTGLPVGTVQKVLGGITKSPRYDTMRALERVLREESSLHTYKQGGRFGTDMVKETTPAYGSRPGKYTLDDYYALPDEQRVELIDGVFYDMEIPTLTHQFWSGAIYRYFSDYIRKNKVRCFVVTAPVDVQLDRDPYTMLQPDLLIVCDLSKIRNEKVVFGAPDLTVEILSPSSKRKDIYMKLMKYARAGVREYWQVDLQKKVTIVYDLEKDEHPVVYGFDRKVPVRIFEGKCQVDFAEIEEYLNFLYGDGEENAEE